MQIPKNIEFMSQLWEIRAAKPKELIDCLGQCDPKTNTILLDPDLPTDVLLQTLTHELLHTLEMTLNQCLTEQQVDVMAAGIVHLLRTNPELLELYHCDVKQIELDAL
jgi:hypothetical protein